MSGREEFSSVKIPFDNFHLYAKVWYMNKRFTKTFIGSFANTPDNHQAIKNLSTMLRKQGVRFRMFRYGRGPHRKAAWLKQVEHSIKTGTGWEGKYAAEHPNTRIYNSTYWRPRLQFCTRFDVYLEIKPV
jgi:hypothetical protein